LAFWSISFPLAAFSSITLRLGEGSAPWFQMLGLSTLAISTLVIAGLCVATLKGLRQGSLLQPEPVANIQPVAQA
jgi:tellurite resistance protein